MPDKKQAAQNVWWLKNEFNIGIPESNLYVAPLYPSTGALEDFSLLNRLRRRNQSIFLFKLEVECRKD